MTPITYTLTPDDMLAGNRLAIRRYVRKGVPRFSLAVLMVSAGVTLLGYSLNPQPLPIVGALFVKIMAIYIAVAAILVAILLFWTPRQRANKNMAQMPALSRPQTVEWNDRAITFTSENGHATIPLTDFHQWAHDDRMLILYPADHLFYFVPKHYVEDTESWDRLITAIRQAGIKQV